LSSIASFRDRMSSCKNGYEKEEGEKEGEAFTTSISFLMKMGDFMMTSRNSFARAKKRLSTETWQVGTC